MFQVTIGEYYLNLVSEGLPDLYNEYKSRAILVDEIDIRNSEGKNCFVSIGRNNDWPFLVVAQRYAPFGCGFNPGTLLIPETNMLFVGAGERLLCYDLLKPRRIWEDFTQVGFLHWSQFKKFILMSAETEFAVWNQEGKKMWSTFVEPPWDYKIVNGEIVLDIMGIKTIFEIETGRKK
jgi:hypothetical protein